MSTVFEQHEFERLLRLGEMKESHFDELVGTALKEYSYFGGKVTPFLKALIFSYCERISAEWLAENVSSELANYINHMDDEPGETVNFICESARLVVIAAFIHLMADELSLVYEPVNYAKFSNLTIDEMSLLIAFQIKIVAEMNTLKSW